jgi:hypothetical protein
MRFALHSVDLCSLAAKFCQTVEETVKSPAALSGRCQSRDPGPRRNELLLRRTPSATNYGTRLNGYRQTKPSAGNLQP